MYPQPLKKEVMILSESKPEVQNKTTNELKEFIEP
jgi:hypothetical protein